MKKILLFLFMFPLLLHGQVLDCGDIDMICSEAQKLVNRGEYAKALEGLNKAKNMRSLRNCAGMSKITKLISRIEGMAGSGTSTSNRTFTARGITFTMVFVKGGTFTMGATSEQGDEGYTSETPTHNETVKDFWVGETEVTQALWQAVMGDNPSDFKGSNNPVEMVSWDDCKKFVEKLNELLASKLPRGHRFRLPTEAEWEYAARGGKSSSGLKYAGGSNAGRVAWYDDNSNSQPHVVKGKNSNELGIYDMSGNVWEWVEDNWRDNYNANYDTAHRAARGGSWVDDARNCRVSIRHKFSPTYQLGYLGLRLAL